VNSTVHPTATVPETPAPPHAAPSAMLVRFGAVGRLLSRAAFDRVHLDRGAVERVRALAERGTIVYVMRHRSLVDFLLVNAVLLREGLPLAGFANGITTLWLHPVREILRRLWARVRAVRLFGREIREARDHDRCVELVHDGVAVLVFMRSPRMSGRGPEAVEAARLGTEYLRDVVHSLWGRPTSVFLVPIAIFRGKGYRKRESRFPTLLYSAQEAPGDAKRLFAYLWNPRDVVMTVGAEIPLEAFVEEHRREGEERIVRRLTRALQIFLHREERVVWGPPLRARRAVREAVLAGDEMRRLVHELAAARGVPERKVEKEAAAYFEEMAANFNGLYFGILEYVFNRLWPRIFSGLEIIGLEKVSACVKEHPIVLVPCHRSHFDYLILSYIFHNNFLSPPHIAAGINLAFWPLGPLFRGAGAFFIRRTFEGNELYKVVFRNYLTFLIREGYTQEFFIEGGRTRTGKILTPKLGMLSAIVGAFIQGVRRDLYLVPVSIHYGRIVEEEAYKRELVGEEKERESLRGLLRARAVLRQRYGTVYVTFAEPISLNEALGTQKERFRTRAGAPDVEEEKRYVIQKLGFRLLREVNAVAVAGATPVSATALLGAPRPAMRIDDFLRATARLTELLRLQRVRFTASLERNIAGGFQESLAWLEAGGLVQRTTDIEGSVLYVPPDKRLNLDFYKNNTIHFFLIPALIAGALRAGIAVAALRDEVWWWLDLYRWEFALPEREALAVEIGHWRGVLHEAGVLADDDADPDHELLRVTAGILDNFREAYWMAAKTVAFQSDWPLSQKVMVQRLRRAFASALLLGDVRKPEANSAVTYENALNRLLELGCIALDASGRGGKERRFVPGPSFDKLPALAERLRP
jgi:glycerol-3-phosphate O-acyltransferase